MGLPHADSVDKRGSFPRPSEPLSWVEPMHELPNSEDIPDEARACGVLPSHGASIYHAFREHVSNHPSRVAVKDASQTLTYLQLDNLAQQLTQWLSHRHYPAETLIGVLATRSVDTVITYMGILAANCCYVPLDAHSPDERLQYVLSSIGSRPLVLCDSADHYSAPWTAAAECVTLADILHASPVPASLDHPWPTSSSLAAVIFTSGTSGRPKGVMIEHRSIVRVAKEESYRLPDDASAPTPVVAHLLNPAFDAAMMEVYTALLNGFTLYCVEADVLLDSRALGQVFRRERVQMALFTAALLDHCLRECPALFKELKVLLVGGDRFKACHARELKRLVQGQVFNCYGPTENTVNSTLYAIPSDDAHIPDDVPIGRAVSGSIACVVDAQLRPVPAGTVGELIVAGDGLARGYLDPKLDLDRFVNVEIDGQTLRAYRTGDLARLCPEDMQLRFEGRIDCQVKIRGYRVEVAEIDRALTRHADVADAATIPFQRDGEEGLELVSFVTESANHLVTDLADKIYADLREPTINLGRDFLGWISMYDGAPIPHAEMEEWLQDTLDTIQSICPHRALGKVLEVGSGSGMLLFNLAPISQQYLALEPSIHAVKFVNEAAKTLPDIAGKAHVHQGSAAGIGYWMDEYQPNLVIVNSVVQSFPSIEYLSKMVEDCAQKLRPHQRTRLFFGDVRSYALYPEFLAHKAFHNRTGPLIDWLELRSIVADCAAIENELLIQPIFFTALVKKLSGVVEHVDIIPKKMRATNELSCYRYAAVVYLRGANAPPMHIVKLETAAWMDWNQIGLDAVALARRLSAPDSCCSPLDTVLAVSNIAYSKIQVDKALADALDEDAGGPDGAGSVALSVSELRQGASSIPSVDIMELEDLARANGLSVRVSWARQASQRGGLDAVFYREGFRPDDGVTEMVFAFPVDNDYTPSGALCNVPHRAQTKCDLRDQLVRFLGEKVPSYMMPTALFVLEKMPLTSNGKTDHQALVRIAASEFDAARKHDGPSTNPTSSSTSGAGVETRLKELWALVLGIDVACISTDDHFIHKGGNSIKAMRLMVEARRRGLNIRVPDILTSPVLGEMASKASEVSATEELAFAEPATDSPPPFELLTRTSGDEARRLTSELSDVSANTIEDIFPCTPLQAGLVALNLERPSDYVGRMIHKLQPDVDVDRFRMAFEHVVQAHPILRTRMVYLPGEGFVQVVTRETICWRSGHSIEKYIQNDREHPFALGDPLVRAALVTEGTRRYFILTMLHCVFDWWSMKIVLADLGKAYRGLTIRPPPPFQSFIQALIKQNRCEAGRQAWISYFHGLEAEQFPRLPSPSYRPTADSVHARRVGPLDWSRLKVIPAVAVRAALAILICQRENMQDVVFGTIAMGRDSLGVSGVEQMSGPTIATVPTRATLSRSDETVGDMLVRLQHEWANLATYEHIGISAIRELSEDAARASTFQTLLMVLPADDQADAHDKSLLFEREAAVTASDNDLGAVSTYAVVMECHLAEDGLAIRVTSDSHAIPARQMERMLSQYEAILLQLCQPEIGRHRLSEVEWLGAEDMRDMWRWNGALPAAIDSAVHDLLAPVFQRQPDAPAICAWDGSLTYQELDRHSTRLAHLILARETSGPTLIIPIMVEKSRWTSVAILAVMKAGGASCVLDPCLPQARLQSIVDQIEPTLVVASPQQEEMARSLCGHCEPIVVDADRASLWPAPSPDQRLPSVPASTSLYLHFTSGSTGVPKGVVVSHRNFSSAIIHQRSRRSVGPQSRVLDYSSLAFDALWLSLLPTLAVGGCVCVTSDADRRDDLKGSIFRLGANFTFLTTSIVSTLDDEALQALDSVEIGGEAADPDEIRRVERHTRVRYGYGPSECTPLTVMTEHGADPRCIGKAAGVWVWPVDPRVPGRLVGVGCIAELWLEGALVGEGYHKDAQRTAATFVQDPAWMRRDRPGRPGRSGRAYRTGDLVRFAPDGTMEFVGRVDAQQAKIHGQRIDLLDVQHHVQDALRARQPDWQVIADVGEGKSKALLAFVWASTTSWASMSFDAQMAVLTLTASGIKTQLAGRIPPYMIPTLFIPVPSLPTTTNGKLDRRRLRDVAAALTPEQRYACSLEADRALDLPGSEPQTAMEKRLRDIWARVLNIDPAHLTTRDNFFSCGGDSISAMAAVNAARRQGLSLSSKSLWDTPRLGELAARLAQAADSAADRSAEHDSPPARPPPVLGHAAHVSHVLPVTWTQAQFMNGSRDGYATSVYYFSLAVPDTRDAAHVSECCARAMQHLDILRARFICTAYRVSQVIERDVAVPWREAEPRGDSVRAATERICEEDRRQLRRVPDAQSCLTRFFFLRAPANTLIVRLSHAQYDGLSLPRMLRVLTDLLHDRPPAPAPPYSAYVRHIMSRNPDSYRYWRDLLRGTASPTSIPPNHQHVTGTVELLAVSTTIATRSVAHAAETPAMRFIAACAAMLSQATYQTDVVFGCIVSGRSSAPVELQTVCGPCLNEIPIRIRFTEHQYHPTTDAAVPQVRKQLLDGSMHDTVGFDEIAAHCTSWPPGIEDFGLTVHYQNSGDASLIAHDANPLSGWRLVEGAAAPAAFVPKANNIDLEALPLPAGNRLQITVKARSSLYQERFLRHILHTVCRYLS